MVGQRDREVLSDVESPLRLVQVEHFDELPVLWAQVQKMRIPTLLDELFPTHGLWKGALSFGEVAGVWLMFIASQGDPCLCCMCSLGRL